MTINPEGWGGNYFNTFSRNGNQVEALPIFRCLCSRGWALIKCSSGAEVLYRSFTGSSVSRPIQLLAAGRRGGSKPLIFWDSGNLQGRMKKFQDMPKIAGR